VAIAHRARKYNVTRVSREDRIDVRGAGLVSISAVERCDLGRYESIHVDDWVTSAISDVPDIEEGNRASFGVSGEPIGGSSSDLPECSVRREDVVLIAPRDHPSSHGNDKTEHGERPGDTPIASRDEPSCRTVDEKEQEWLGRSEETVIGHPIAAH